MYTEKIKTQDEAICHLFFHCCLKDGRFSKPEIDVVSDLLVRSGFHGKLNFKDEVIKYRSYQPTITDDAPYIRHLIQLIKPANELALYSYCVELCLGDAGLSPEEEHLLDEIASALDIPAEEQSTIKKLSVERKVVEEQKLF